MKQKNKNHVSFQKEYEKLLGKYSPVDVFCDIVDLTVAFLQLHGDKELGERLRKKYGNDYQQLNICIPQLLNAYSAKLEFEEWGDVLGELYEEITSSYKSSRLGQFFTPAPVCNLIATITMGSRSEGCKVNDPACGSGRILLAANSVAPNNLHYATDIDEICVKMAAINMCLHGIRGQVVCANGLVYGDTWRFGFQINNNLRFGIPGIEKITQENCLQSGVFMRDFVEKKEVEVPKKEVEKFVQLSLF